MNNGKICVSVCAETAEHLINQAKRAEQVADIVELRFDCLNDGEFDLAIPAIARETWNVPFLATFRPQDGLQEFTMSVGVTALGKSSGSDALMDRFTSLEPRLNNFKQILALDNVKFLDFEIDLFLGLLVSGSLNAEIFANRQIVVSEHDFEKVPEHLEEFYEELMNEAHDSNIRCDIFKYAATANDLVDSIAIWRLLGLARSQGNTVIPIAMGPSGKWTRILGLAHDAFLTYASLEAGSETAPGQVTAKELIEVYRAKELDENTDVYGVLANPVGHSLSPEIQNAAFIYHKLNAVYLPFEVKDLDAFIERMVREETREIDLNFKGFSVTIPHKQAIIKHLDFVDPAAQTIGAVNTIKIVGGKLHGYNTDAEGFMAPLKQAYGEVTRAGVAVLGAGGSARACVYALKQEGADVTIFARDAAKGSSLAAEFGARFEHFTLVESGGPLDFDIVVNTTPLGMKGKHDRATPLAASQLKGVKLVYDLVFNPVETPLLKEAASAGVPALGGLAMLIAQGAAQQKIWTGLEAPIKEMRDAAEAKIGR